jgi:hypothetical protein
MQDFRSVFFLLFPMVGEFHRAPVGDVATFSFAEYSIEHSGSTEQADVSAMQRCERPASDVPLFGEKHTAGLTVCC